MNKGGDSMATKKEKSTEKTKETKKKAGRKPIELDCEQFEKLVGLGCTAKEICWWFMSSTGGKQITIDTLSRWCERTYNMNFADYKAEYGGIQRNFEIRQNQLELSKHSAAMAIFLGKNYLGQRDTTEIVDNTPIEKLDEILKGIKENADNSK